MATHEHLIGGKRWLCLTSIETDEDRHLFQMAGVLYNELFTEEEKEPYDNFSDYLTDSGLARRAPEDADVIDTLSLAFEEGELKGFLFFSWYPKLGLVFNPYVGFRHTRSRQLFDTVPDVVADERRVVGLHGRQIEGVIFELEKFEPGALLSRTRSQAERTALKRAQLTRRYQESGAWLIPWVDYKQPPLEKRRRAYPMHLMYWPVDAGRRNDPGLFSRRDVERLIRFAYEVFYLDGFKSTEPEEDWPYWEALTKQLSNEALLYVPNTNFLLEKVAARDPLDPTFVSYAGPDERMAALIEKRLHPRGSPVFFWPTGSKQAGGQTISQVVRTNMRTSKYFVFLVTPNVFFSSGQKDEIEHVLESRHDAVVQIITNVQHSDLQKLGFPVSGSSGIVYHRFVDDRDFPLAVDNCIQSILQISSVRAS